MCGNCVCASHEYLAKRFSERVWDVFGDLLDILPDEDADLLTTQLVTGLLTEIGDPA